MMLTGIIALPALKDNYIWLFYDGAEAWVVDPGEAEPVIVALKQYQLNLRGILITHHHADHSGGVTALLTQWKNAEVIGSHQSRLPFITHKVKEHDDIFCGKFKFNAIEIPGHTLDHIAYYTEGSLFSGDTLFSMGCGKIFEGTPHQLFYSLAKLVPLPDETRLYCGHEYTLKNLLFANTVDPSNQKILQKISQITALRDQNQPSLPALLGEEKELNPFLRCEDTTIIQAVENYAQKKLTEPAAVFAYLREWKNNFS